MRRPRLVSLLVVAGTVRQSGGAVHPKDLAAWQALYDSTDGPNWKDCAQLRNKPCLCGTEEAVMARYNESQVTGSLRVYVSGEGVTCKTVNGSTDRIVGISLQQWNLKGTPVSLAPGMQELKVLSLGQNSLTGPADFACNLPKMKHLQLHGNRLVGSVPGCFGKMLDLRTLHLSGNLLTGLLPKKNFSKLENLEELVLDEQGTFREDEIPADANKSRCRVLTRVALGWSPVLIDPERSWSCGGLIGDIPSSFSKLYHLKVLSASGNRLRGPLPNKLPRSIMILDLSDNGFTFPFPLREWQHQLHRLLEINLSNNPIKLSWFEFFKFFRAIHEEIRSIKLSYVGLKGSMPKMGVSFQALKVISLANNQIIGPVTEFEDLTHFDIRNNSRMYGCVGHPSVDVCERGPANCLLDGTNVSMCPKYGPEQMQYLDEQLEYKRKQATGEVD